MKTANNRGSAGMVVLVILGILFFFFALGTCSSKSPQSEGWEKPVVTMTRVMGRYVESDGIRTIFIKEVYGDGGWKGGWNGELSFTPAVGDWKNTLRCRVSGKHLVVELPAQKRVLVKMFVLHDSQTILGEISPWNGVFIRR